MDNRLVAETSGDLTRCCICRKLTPAIHWHHTVPQSCGGKDSLQIPVCGDCHTTLHSHASGMVASIRSGTPNTKRYWANPHDERRAQQWLQILIQATLVPPVSVGDKQVLLSSLSVDLSTRQQLELLKKDLPGITNIEQTLLFCVNYTLKNRGYKNERQPDNKGHNKGNKRKTHLW